MTILFPLAVAALAGVAWWVAQSAARIAGALLLAAATRHAPIGLTAGLAVALAGLAAWIVWRALSSCGWRLIVTTAPRTAPTS